MTERPGPDDRTARIGDGEDDATRRLDEVDDPTRAMPRADDATQAMARGHVHEPAATHHLEPISAPASTRTERIALPARPAVGAWLIAALVVIGLIVGGLLGYMQTEASDDNVVAQALVDADGGVLTFDQVGRLEVPRDALPTATAITIRREKLDRRVRLGAADDPRSRVYDAGELDVYVFEPADLRFQRPVKITLPRQGDAAAVLVDSEDTARVLPAKGNAATVELETMNFSFDQTGSAVGRPSE